MQKKGFAVQSRYGGQREQPERRPSVRASTPVDANRDSSIGSSSWLDIDGSSDSSPDGSRDTSPVGRALPTRSPSLTYSSRPRIVQIQQQPKRESLQRLVQAGAPAGTRASHSTGRGSLDEANSTASDLYHRPPVAAVDPHLGEPVVNPHLSVDFRHWQPPPKVGGPWQSSRPESQGLASRPDSVVSRADSMADFLDQYYLAPRSPRSPVSPVPPVPPVPSSVPLRYAGVESASASTSQQQPWGSGGPRSPRSMLNKVEHANSQESLSTIHSIQEASSDSDDTLAEPQGANIFAAAVQNLGRVLAPRPPPVQSGATSVPVSHQEQQDSNPAVAVASPRKGRLSFTPVQRQTPEIPILTREATFPATTPVPKIMAPPIAPAVKRGNAPPPHIPIQPKGAASTYASPPQPFGNVMVVEPAKPIASPSSGTAPVVRAIASPIRPLGAGVRAAPNGPAGANALASPIKPLGSNPTPWAKTVRGAQASGVKDIILPTKSVQTNAANLTVAQVGVPRLATPISPMTASQKVSSGTQTETANTATPIRPLRAKVGDTPIPQPTAAALASPVKPLGANNNDTNNASGTQNGVAKLAPLVKPLGEKTDSTTNTQPASAAVVSPIKPLGGNTPTAVVSPIKPLGSNAGSELNNQPTATALASPIKPLAAVALSSPVKPLASPIKPLASPVRPLGAAGANGVNGQTAPAAVVSPVRPLGSRAIGAANAQPAATALASPIRPLGARAGGGSNAQPGAAGLASPVRPLGARAGGGPNAQQNGAGAASPVRPLGANAATPANNQGVVKALATPVRPLGADPTSAGRTPGMPGAGVVRPLQQGTGVVVKPLGAVTENVNESSSDSASDGDKTITDEKPQGPLKLPPGPLNDPRNRKTKKAQFGQSFRNFIRIFSFTTKRDRFFITLSVIGAIGTGLTFPAMTLVFGNMIGNVTAAIASGLDGTPQQAMTDVIDNSVLEMVYLFAARFVLGYIATLGFKIMSIRVSSAIRLAYLRALLGQRVSLLDTQPPGQLAAIITTTSNTLQNGISEKLALLIQSFALMAGAMANAFYHSWKLTLVTSSGLLLIIICYCITTPFIVKNMKEVESINMKASGVASEAFGSIRMIAACGAEKKMERKYDKWILESRLRGIRLSRITAVQKAVIFFSITGTFALSCWFAARMMNDGEIETISTLIIVLMCVMMTTNTIGNIAQPISAASRASNAARILFNGINAPRPKTEGAKGPEVDASAKIVLWNVNFTYPGRPKHKILDQLRLVIQAGKTTAIVGPSGSGKSTIVNLILRWYELDGGATGNKMVQFFRNGSVKCGTKPLHEIDLKWWRSQIGIVQQDSFLFNDTIFENVAAGLIGTEWEHAPEAKKRELVVQACKEAFAEEFITTLPDGYETPVGDAGSKLSGGQRQRLAIARAIVRQPKILILDEATSAIDVKGERLLQEALERVSKGRTTIMIAHRLSTVKNADNIIVMSKGKVVQWGKHAQLIAKKGGPYWVLSNAQQVTMGGDEVGHSDENEVSEMSEFEKGTFYTTETDEPRYSEEADEPSYKAKGLFKAFGPMYAEQKRHWLWYIIMFFGVLIAGATAPTQAYLFAALLSSMYLRGPTLLQVTNFWCIMFVILAGGAAIGYFALGFASTRLSFLITTSYQREYFRNTMSKPVSFFDYEDHSASNLTGRLASDSRALQQLLGSNMAFVLIAVLSVSGCLTVAFYFGWKLTAIAMSCAMPLAMAAGFFRTRADKSFQKMNSQVFAESARFATESMSAIRTVTALTLEDKICQRYEKLLDDHVKRAFRKARVATIVFSASEAIPLLCMGFILWYGGGLLVSGQYDSFQYLVVYIAVIQGAMGVGQWLSYVPNVSQAREAANRFHEMRMRDFNEEDGIKEGDDMLELNEKGDHEGPKIELQDVWFKYPTRDVPVLCGLDMTIEKGQFAAIVGPSGCGKTSVISLLERFYKTKSGSVILNGVEIDEINLRDYRKMISLVAQDPYMFQGTIRENILFGVNPDSITEDELHQACRDAEIHDFVVSLPEGYNTMVGFKGILLSGGQKQRMSIARALIRNPRLLLLDEATSALDSETEKLVQSVFEKTKKSRTMVVVAHRLATIQNADVIFVLGEGTVREKGTHAELLQKKGIYWSMCQAQALDR